MAKIYNGTPHNINVVTNAEFVAAIRKYCTDAPEFALIVPSSGMLSAKIITVQAGCIDGLPIYDKKIVDCDPVPEGYDIIIVSQLYATAVIKMGLDTTGIYTVSDPVYSMDGQTFRGCIGVCPIA